MILVRKLRGPPCKGPEAVCRRSLVLLRCVDSVWVCVLDVVLYVLILGAATVALP